MNGDFASVNELLAPFGDMENEAASIRALACAHLQTACAHGKSSVVKVLGILFFLIFISPLLLLLLLLLHLKAKQREKFGS